MTDTSNMDFNGLARRAYDRLVNQGDVITVTLSLDTNAYADGDVMADTQVVTGAIHAAGGEAILHSVLVLDEDDQGQTFDILLLNADNSIGTENSAPSITDANARTIVAAGTPTNDLRISSGDYIDLGGCRVAMKTNIGAVVKAASGSSDLYVATVIRGAATYSASGVKLMLGFLQAS
jgi:hypothetical protein